MVDHTIIIGEIRDAVLEQAWRIADSKILEYLKQNPNDPDALMYLGVSKAAQGYEPEGEHHLLASLTFNPQNRDAYLHLGIIVLEQGRCILASEAFKKGLSIDQTNHQLFYHLGRALERLGKSDEAIEAYQHALQNKPDHDNVDFSLEAENAIGRIAAAQKDSAEPLASCDD